MQITIDVFGDVQVSRNLMRFRDRAMNMIPAFQIEADLFLRHESKQFDSQGAYASGGWAPLAASTIARKARLGQDPRILHATLAMRRSLTVKGAPGQIRRIRRDSMEVGTSVKSPKGFPYPAVHQRGGGHVPRRRPVEFRESDKREMIRRIQHYLVYGTV